jgi:hypothetical protein
MAVVTGAGPSMTYREGMRATKLGRRPGGGGVAGGAIRAEQTHVISWLRMAGNTGSGCACEDIVDVTLGAL